MDATSAHIGRSFPLVSARRAYEPVAKPVQAEPIAKIEKHSRVQTLPGKAQRLVAARVSGGIDFAAQMPKPVDALPFYRHPADQNAASVALQAGRILDVTT